MADKMVMANFKMLHYSLKIISLKKLNFVILNVIFNSI